MPEKSTQPHPRWQKREDALKARASRPREAKKRDARLIRLREVQAIQRILVRSHGVQPDHAPRVVPVTLEAMDRIGRPPRGLEVYEFVESRHGPYKGVLPLQLDAEPWGFLTRQWNASNAERPEVTYYTKEGKHDWRALRSAYLTAARKLEAKARTLYEAHKKNCPICARSTA